MGGVRQVLVAHKPRGVPSMSLQNSGPRSSKRLSARLRSTMPVSGFQVAKLDLKAMSPSPMGTPAPMLSNAPRP